MSRFQRIAFIFPGQGAQYCGMGKDFCEAFPIAKETFEEADDALNRKLSHLIFQGPEDQLTETRNSQVAIYVTSIALLRVLQHQFSQIVPYICGGLSLGEYTAITASHRLTFQECLPLVQKRAQFMNDACEATQGAMAAVMGLEAEVVEQALRDLSMPNQIWAANFNCPAQVVISGTLAGVQVASEKLKANGAKRVLPLQVHGAFHSGLMAEAERRLAEHVNQASFANSSIGLVMNVSGGLVRELAQVRQLMIQQVTSPVRWEQCVRTMMGEGIDLFIEIGPGKTLTGLNKRIGVTVPTVSIEKLADLDALQNELNA